MGVAGRSVMRGEKFQYSVIERKTSLADLPAEDESERGDVVKGDERE